MSTAVPLHVPFPPGPQDPAADFGQGCASRVLYRTGLNCKKSLKDRDYPTFPKSKYVWACVFHMKNRAGMENTMEKLKIVSSVQS